MRSGKDKIISDVLLWTHSHRCVSLGCVTATGHGGIIMQGLL